MISHIEQELREITKVKGTNADRQEFLSALLHAAHELKDDQWDDLSQECQNWSNDATRAEKEGKPLPEFPDWKEDGNPVKATAGNEKTNSGKKKVASKSEKTKKAAPPKEKAVKVAKTLQTDGAKYRIKKAILAKPAISVDELVEKLGKGADKISRFTIAGIRAEFRHSLRVLVQEGKLKIDL